MLRSRLLCGVMMCCLGFGHAIHAQDVIDESGGGAVADGAAATDAMQEAEVQSENSVESPAPARDEIPKYSVAVLQALNKVTTKTSTIKVPTGATIRFGNIEIVARTCWKAPPEEHPEVATLLDIWELKPDEAPARIFLGWMFASSPAISALEHPVYDIVVKDCVYKAIGDL